MGPTKWGGNKRGRRRGVGKEQRKEAESEESNLSPEMV